MMGFRPLRISQRGLSTISPSSLTPSSGFGVAAGVGVAGDDVVVGEGFSADFVSWGSVLTVVAFGAGVAGADGVLVEEVLDAVVDPPLPGARGAPPRIEKSENHGV